MSEQEQMDQWLRDAMSGSAPRLSASFDARLEKRLRPRGLTATGRVVMAAYVLAALLVSAWALRNATLDWTIVAAVLLPSAVAASAYGRRLRANARWARLNRCNISITFLEDDRCVTRPRSWRP